MEDISIQNKFNKLDIEDKLNEALEKAIKLANFKFKEIEK